MDGWFKWQEKWQMLPDKWMDWQIDGKADRSIEMQSDRKKGKKEKWKNRTNRTESELSSHIIRPNLTAEVLTASKVIENPAPQLVLHFCWRVNFRFAPHDWTDRKAGWDGEGGLAFSCLLAIEQVEKHRFPLSWLRPVTSINALKGGTRALRGTHTHSYHQKHACKGLGRRVGKFDLYICTS